MKDLGNLTERTTRCECGNEFSQRGVVIDGRFSLGSPPRCEVCQARAEDALARTIGERRSDRVRAEEVAREKRAREAVAALDVPPLYQGVTLDSFVLHGSRADRDQQMRTITRGRRYLAQFPDVDAVLLLRGGPGTGKGHWCWSVAQALAAVGVRVGVVKLADLIRELRASWRTKDADSEATVLGKYRAFDLLVVDELSRHAFYGERVHQHLYDVIDHRVEHRRPTILTSNEDDQGVADILRPALVSRLVGNGQVYEFGDADYRQRTREDTGEVAA